MRLHRFDERRIPTTTVEEVNQHLKDGPIVVTGRLGTGRSSAVREVCRQLPEGIFIRFGRHAARSANGMLQLAAATGSRHLLPEFVRRGTAPSLELVDQIVADRPIFVDDADALLHTDLPGEQWLDSIPGMVAPDDAHWSDWLLQRRSPTVLVSERCSRADVQIVRHGLGGPEDKRWPIVLNFAEEGSKDWPALARKLWPRLDLFYLARVATPFLSQEAFDELVHEFHRDRIMAEFARVFRKSGGRQVDALDLLSSLPDVPARVARHALALALPRTSRDPLVWLSEVDELFDRLVRNNLISVTSPGAIVEVLPALFEYGAVETLPPARSGKLADALLARVNDPSSLDPGDAAFVLAAHDLAVRAGLDELATRTATLHVHGLVNLARSLSRDEEHKRAWRLYDDISRLLPSERVVSDESLRRVRAYVVNYRAFNGRRAEVLQPKEALRDVEEAVSLWPGNARWHGHRVELLFRLGRTADAMAAVVEAEEAVDFHVQRARHLRVRPAFVATQEGELRCALELLQLSQPTWADDSEACALVAGQLRSLERGVDVPWLHSPTHRLVFYSPQRVKLVLSSEQPRWMVVLDALSAMERQGAALEALDALVASLSGEIRGLLAQPTPWLADSDADRKAEMIGVVDVLQSDVGLPHPKERWFVGRIQGHQLVVQDVRIGRALEVRPEALEGLTTRVGLWFGRADVDRAGFPISPVDALEPAGSGLTAAELREALEVLWHKAS